MGQHKPLMRPAVSSAAAGAAGGRGSWRAPAGARPSARPGAATGPVPPSHAPHLPPPRMHAQPLLCPEIHGESGLDGPLGGPVLPPSDQRPLPGKAPCVMFEHIAAAHRDTCARLAACLYAGLACWWAALLGRGPAGRGAAGAVLAAQEVAWPADSTTQPGWVRAQSCAGRWSDPGPAGPPCSPPRLPAAAGAACGWWPRRRSPTWRCCWRCTRRCCP